MFIYRLNSHGHGCFCMVMTLTFWCDTAVSYHTIAFRSFVKVKANVPDPAHNQESLFHVIIFFQFYHMCRHDTTGTTKKCEHENIILPTHKHKTMNLLILSGRKSQLTQFSFWDRRNIELMFVAVQSCTFSGGFLLNRTDWIFSITLSTVDGLKIAGLPRFCECQKHYFLQMLTSALNSPKSTKRLIITWPWGAVNLLTTTTPGNGLGALTNDQHVVLTFNH